MQTCDIAVIGAGIVGAACAYELSSSGLRVTVVDPNGAGSGATALGYGSLSIRHDQPGQFELTRFGLTLWNKLAEYLPEDCEYRGGGSILVAANDAEMKQALKLGEVFIRQGLDVEFLIGRELAEAEPGLRTDLAGGVYIAEDGSVNAGRAAEFLLQLASRNGAQVLRQQAQSINEHEVALSDGSILYAGNIVNAAGKEAAILSPSLPTQLSKGHVLVVETDGRCTGRQLSALAMTSEPAADARVRLELRQGPPQANNRSEVWIGSSWQPVARPRASDLASTQVEPRIVALLLRRAIDMVPLIGRAKPLRSWTGLRTITPDGLPLIGRVAGKESIFAAAAHGGLGASAALATGRLITDEILCRTPAIDPQPYLPSRFEDGS